MNLLYQITTPVIFAHRGASAVAPENTLSAFHLALEQGADAIELDAKLSADGHVMVIHDPSVDRVTGERGLVRKLTLHDLKSLDAGSCFSQDYHGEKIPTLKEVLEEVGHHTLVNIELTNYTTPNDSLPERVAAVVKHHHLEDHVLFSSFLIRNLQRIKTLLPQIPVALLASPGIRGLFARSFIGRRVSPQVIHLHHTDVTSTLMKRETAAKRRVHTWTINDPDQMIWLNKLRVQGLFTDNPGLAKQILEKTLINIPTTAKGQDD